ncbi:MAG: hypothetical protein H7290_06660 [Flavobacterium sp.]|nr:hypothetical protein [Aeromicrobium sp.]
MTSSAQWSARADSMPSTARFHSGDGLALRAATGPLKAAILKDLPTLSVGNSTNLSPGTADSCADAVASDTMSTATTIPAMSLPTTMRVPRIRTTLPEANSIWSTGRS